MRRLIFLFVCFFTSFATTGKADNFDESKVPPYTLPDPLVCDDGSPVRDIATWQQKRRAELLEHFARDVYGRTPTESAKEMHWEVTAKDRSALGGLAVCKEITIWFTRSKDGPKMHLLLFQPNGTAPEGGWPVFLGLNFFGNASVHPDRAITLPTAWMRKSPPHHIVNHRATEATRGTHASRWQIETVLKRGYATATAYYGDLCPDRPEGLTEAVGALFGTRADAKREGDEWGAIGIWAWGLSRAMDYLVTDPELDARRVALHGHSRLGKAALWAGAQDERFALVISNNSGSAGAKLMRRHFGSTIAFATSSFPFWFSRNYAAYSNRDQEVPVDQHQLIALIAPRAVHVGSAIEDLRADPRGEFSSVKGAEPVYQLFGKRGLGISDMPAVDQPVLGDAMAYHVRSGKHDITAYDWAQYLDFADRELAK